MPRALTATEEQILDDLRAGRLDAEIAVRLGISIADLKHRITAILRDYRLLNREELLEWDPPEATAEDEAERSRVRPEGGGRGFLVAGGAATVMLLAAMVAVVAVRPWEESGRAMEADTDVLLPLVDVPADPATRVVDFGESVVLTEASPLGTLPASS